MFCCFKSRDLIICILRFLLLFGVNGGYFWGLKNVLFFYVDFWTFADFLEVACRDKSTSGHSLSLKETVEVASVDVKGATAYEISGIVSDCL